MWTGSKLYSSSSHYKWRYRSVVLSPWLHLQKDTPCSTKTDMISAPLTQVSDYHSVKYGTLTSNWGLGTRLRYNKWISTGYCILALSYQNVLWRLMLLLDSIFDDPDPELAYTIYLAALQFTNRACRTGTHCWDYYADIFGSPILKWFDTRLILGLHPANERRRCKVTASLFGWAQTNNQADSRLAPSQWDIVRT